MAARSAGREGSRLNVAAERIDHSDGEGLTEGVGGMEREPAETENWPGVKVPDWKWALAQRR